MAIQIRKCNNIREQHAGRLEIRNAPGADWMVDEVYTQKYVDWPLCVKCPFFLCMIGASKVDHSATYLRRRLLLAAGGSLRFGCQHPAPRRIRSSRHPFRVAAFNKKIINRSIRAKIVRFETFGGQETGYRKVARPWTNE